MSAVFIFSTLTSAVNYNVYSQAAKDLPVVERAITVNGGANLADRKTLDTPRGVLTKVSAEDFELLEQNPVFQLHRTNGYITVSDSDGDPEKVAAEMTTRDASAPLTEGDFEANGEEAPAVGAQTTRNKRK